MTIPTSGTTPRPYQRYDQIERLGEPPWKPSDAALVLWEQAHGHDVRLKCYTEYGCLLIERDLEQAEADLAEARALLASLVEANARGSMMYVVVAAKNAEAFLAAHPAQPEVGV